MCAAGYVDFLPENTHLMYLNFPCMPPLSTSQYKSTKSVRPKLWLHLEFNQQDKYPKPFRLLQFREDQRTDAGVFLMWFINILQCQQTHKVLIPWLQQVSNKGESFPLQGGFFHSPTPVFPQCLGPWLGYYVREGFPLPHTVTGYHNTWQTS